MPNRIHELARNIRLAYPLMPSDWEGAEMPEPHNPILGPTALRLKPVLITTEQLGYWLKGKLRKDEQISVELSFEQLEDLRGPDGTQQFTKSRFNFPGSPFTYILMRRSIQTVFEFELGKMIQSSPEAAEHVYDLVTAVQGHHPIPVTDRPPDHLIDLKRQERSEIVGLMPRIKGTTKT